MVAIRALLEGADADLRYLAGVFSAGRIRVEKQGTTYWFSGVGLDNKNTALEATTELLAVVNGRRHDTKPGLQGSDPAREFPGRRETQLRHEAIHPAGPAQPQRKPHGHRPWPDGPAHTDAASRNPHMAEALALLGEPGAELDFARLYKIYEIIEHSGVLNALMRSTGISKGDLRRFTHTAKLSGPPRPHEDQGP